MSAEKPMPNRERFLAICRGEKPGEMSILDWFNRPMVDTPEEWIKNGAPPQIEDGAFFNRYFGFEHAIGLQEIIADVNRADLKEDAGAGVFVPPKFYVTPPVVPPFERKVISQDERHRVETTCGGSTIEVSIKNPWRMPMYLDHPVKDRATWNEYKKRLDPDSPGRWPADWDAYVERVNNQDAPVLLLLSGFFGVLREWMGLESLLYTFYDDPALVEDMMEQVLYLDMGVAQRALKDLRVDFVRFWEDMAYKSGSMISPAMVRKFMVPRYRKMTDFLHSKGVDVIHVDSDGNIDELIPIWLEVGINFPWPLEAAAGMDAVALRKKYGKDLILSSNIDKRVFANGREAIRQEVMSKVPFLMAKGQYFPGLDHLIPPNVSFDDFRYFVNLLREISGQENIPE